MCKESEPGQRYGSINEKLPLVPSIPLIPSMSYMLGQARSVPNMIHVLFLSYDPLEVVVIASVYTWRSWGSAGTHSQYGTHHGSPRHSLLCHSGCVFDS